MMNAVYDKAGARVLLWAVHGLSWLVQLLGFGVVVVRSVRRRRLDLLAVLLLVGLADITALYVASGKSGFVHYTTIVAPLTLLPLLALFRGVPKKVWRIAAPAYVGLFLIAGGLGLRAFYGGLEGTIPDQLAIVRRIHQERAGRPFAMVAGSQWIFGSAYYRLSVVLEKQPWEPQPGVPARDTFVVFTRADWDQGPRPGLEVLELLPHVVLTRVAR
jgi:hypothetical protein